MDNFTIRLHRYTLSKLDCHTSMVVRIEDSMLAVFAIRTNWSPFSVAYIQEKIKLPCLRHHCLEVFRQLGFEYPIATVHRQPRCSWCTPISVDPFQRLPTAIHGVRYNEPLWRYATFAPICFKKAALACRRTKRNHMELLHSHMA